VPTDQIVTWLYGDLDQGEDDDEKKKDKERKGSVDLSQLGDSEGSETVESGVTSGADPSSWDPIDINGNP
jgi:hypothetical protein